MRTDLVAVHPGAADLFHGGPDALDVVEADVGGAGAVLGRVVGVLPVAREQVDTAEEVRHPRVVLLADRAEVREQLLAVLAGAVPGEDHELRRPLTGSQALGLRLHGLRPGVRGRAVADEFDLLGGALWRGLAALGAARPAPVPPAQPATAASAIVVTSPAVTLDAAAISHLTP
ncbi:hypothetical protein [Streptomyces sp. Ac-502]|uniref:hypothetical protein n=1 Tax=Streptomyces sp. Ac-502 TaxID=3342801 RepID=UPI00386239A1